MTEGLLYVLSEPGRVPEAEFHEWYDTEHGPARLTVPGIHGGERYRAVDDTRPSWLAVYPLELAALESPEYGAVRERSPRERSVVERLDTLDRRVYEHVSTSGAAPDRPRLLLSVGLTSTDAHAVDAWYDGEHIPALLAVPGWRRVTRYRLVEGSGPALLAVHEVDDVAAFDTVEYKAATDTPLRTEVMRTVTALERRLFGHHRTIAS